MTQNKILDSALFYWELGFMPIPMHVFFETAGNARAEKKPLCNWGVFQTERAKKEELVSLFSNPKSQIAILTGKQADILVIDQDLGASEEHVALLNSFSTLVVQTPSGGRHHYYKYPKTGIEIKSKSDAFGKKSHIDVRAEGGLAMVPPSKYPNEVAYSIDGQFTRERMMEFPNELLKMLEKEKESISGSQNLEQIMQGVEIGNRNDSGASIAGAIFASIKPALWETIGWEQFQTWNNKNNPPLTALELKTIWESIKKYHINKSSSDPDKDKESQTDKLIKIALENPEVCLFRNELDDTFICFPAEGHKEYWPCNSKQTKWWLIKEFGRLHGKSPNIDAIKNALNTIESDAYFGGKKFTLSNRVAFKDDEIFYSLSNENWRAIRITSNGWSLEKDVPILFRRHAHQNAQIVPEKGGDIQNIFKYVNVKNEEHRIIFLVWIVTCFIPDFPHPILYIYGPQGSAKSTVVRLLKKIIDPSKIETFEIPKDQKELVQKLSHHWCLMFDNISYISPELSDILCRAVTGSGFSKRELYSDDSDVIYTFKRCMSINGINLLAIKPDLLERSILIELERISKSERKNEQDLMKEFEEDLPGILGAIMDVVVNAIRIRPSVVLTETPRMADFALWGYAISEALGYGGNKFIECYFRNINLQHEEVVNESSIASFIVSLMEKQDYWEGSASKLLELMVFDVSDRKDVPRTPQALSRQLNILKTNLEEYGIIIERVEGRKRKIIIRKKGETTASTASLLSVEDINNSKTL